jgi:DNA-binding NarL/FixJ family response regulator
MATGETASLRPVTAKIRVAVCDDARAVKFFLRQVLEEEGDIEVVAATSTGREALEKIVDCPTDVLLLDLVLPDVPDPAALVGHLRERSPQTAIVLISNMPPSSLEKEALRLQADGWMSKAAKPAQLRETVREAMGATTG